MSEPSKPIQPYEKVNDACLNDDSFDDEFRLLESTLTDTKEDDFKAESTEIEKRGNGAGTFLLGLVDITHGENSIVLNQGFETSIPLKLQETNLMSQEVLNRCNVPTDIISSTDLNSTESFKIDLGLSENLGNKSDAQSIPLPSTQQFKSLSNLSCVSSSENLEFKCVSLNSVSSCDKVSGIMQSSSKSLSSVQDNIDNKYDGLTHCKISVNVAPCDSSFVESQERIFQILTDNPLQSNTEDKINVNKKVLSDKLDCPALKYKELDKVDTNEADNFTNNVDSDSKCYPSSLKTESGVENLKQNDVMMQSTENKETMPLCPTAKSSLERLVDSTDGHLEINKSSEILLDTDITLEDIVSTSRTNNCIFDDEVQKDKMANCDAGIKKEKSTFFCSTPIVVSNLLKDNGLEDIGSIERSSDQVSPLNTNYVKCKINQKRKNLCLERIEEVDERTDGCSDKRLKLGSPTSCENNMIVQKNDSSVSSSMPCFEPPAKSILKKWHPNCLSTKDSFFILDECGESESEETIKLSQESVDHTSVAMDDFEVACKSLAEELLMSSSNSETLEKYHSQVQLDSQIDDKIFDEVLQELTLNYEMDEKSFLSKMKPTEESKFVTRENVPNCSLMTVDESVNGTENKENPTLVQELPLGDDKTILAELKGRNSVSETDNCEDKPGPSSSSQHKAIKCENEKIVPTNGTDEKLAMDEEDVLLDEDIKVEPKQYVYFEYVSTDPKENEDNYNPEWQKLGKLTSDEERYKAVRDRWRSLVPPDPNRDLTFRQWRKKNNKPPLNIPSLNNNQRIVEGSERNQLCTAVFERKIANMLQDLQVRRMQITNERKASFVRLAVVQDDQQQRILMRGTDPREMSEMQRYHIQECISLKNRFDMLLEKETKTTEGAVMALKSACNEVMSFQKFYKGVGATDREECMYMSDIQVEELMETEEMLERYSKYYQ